MSAPAEGDADWNAAISEACAMCLRVSEEASDRAEGKRSYTYADGWEDAAIECERVIRDLAVVAKPEDKE